RSGRAPSRSTTGWAGREPTAGTTSPTQPGRPSRASRRSSTTAECIRPGRGGEMGKHNSLREGARLGLVVATSIWVWLAVVDAVAGEPFRTFTVLGGIALFTTMHYLLNLAYGVVIVSAIHGAAREPSLVMAVAFGFPIVEFVFALATVLLSNLVLRELSCVGR